MTAAEKPVVAGTLVLSESSEPCSEPGNLVRRLDARTSFETKHLHEFCFSAPTGISHDIASLLGAVRLADRGFVRHHSRAWERTLEIELPVYELSTWRTQTVTNSLEDCCST